METVGGKTRLLWRRRDDLSSCLLLFLPNRPLFFPLLFDFVIPPLVGHSFFPSSYIRRVLFQRWSSRWPAVEAAVGAWVTATGRGLNIGCVSPLWLTGFASAGILCAIELCRWPCETKRPVTLSRRKQKYGPVCAQVLPAGFFSSLPLRSEPRRFR